MSDKKIKACYAVDTIPDKTFLIVIPKTATVQEFIDKVNLKQKSEFKYVWLDNSQIDTEDVFDDYFDSSSDQIFILTKTEEPPTADLLEQLTNSKKGVSRPKIGASGSSLGSHVSPSPTPTPAPARPPSVGGIGAPGKIGPLPPVTKAPPSIGKASPPAGVAPPGVGRPAGATPPSSGPSSIGKPSVGPPSVTPSATPGIPSTGSVTPSNPFNTSGTDKTFAGFVSSNLGLRTDKTNRPKAAEGKYRFFCTATPELMLEGIDVDLNLSFNPHQCQDHLLNCIKTHTNVSGLSLQVYLPGGLPFIAGTLSDFFSCKSIPSIRVIYGILTRRISDVVLNNNYPELCNVSDPDRKLLVSPLCDSTDKGLSDMACLLGYLNHDGVKGDLLLKSAAAVTHFPPLIATINRIIERMQVTGRDIACFSASMFCYFKYMLPSNIPNNKVFEYGLRCCNIFSHVNDIPTDVPILSFEVKPTNTDPANQCLVKLKMPKFVYFIKVDMGTEFHFLDLKKPDPMAIEQANNTIASFRPIAPLSMRSCAGCTIVQGRNQTFLYLMQSASKDQAHQNFVDIIDPMTGLTESKDVELFSKEQGNSKDVGTANLIDPDRVKQIIMVAFDESGSMAGDLAGYIIRPNVKDDRVHRVTIATQYLTTFANRTYGYRIPCIQGLTSFNNVVTKRCPLSPLVPDFEDLGLKNVNPESTTHLWDAISTCADEIIKFNTGDDGKPIYKNATCRILVISDGEDYTSESKPEVVAQKLLKNNIIVDSVVVSSEDECKMLCALCHVTGGLSFKPKTVSEGLSLFEQSAFLNYEERKLSSSPIIKGDRNTIPAKLKKSPAMITTDFMQKAAESAEFDVEVLNKELASAQTNTRLATPRHVIHKNKDTTINVPRQRRILRELHAAAEVNDPENIDRFDPDLRIYTFQSNLDRWRVYIKGSEGTPYANKWWYLFVTFPELYPVEPPIFRFVTIPYHLNVSSEGRICLNIIEKGYISSKHVVDIIQEIKELFLLPNPETPIKIETRDVFQHDPEKYKRLARESAEKYAKDSYQEYLEKAFIIDEVPDDFKVSFDEGHIPQYMMSQISGKFLDPKSPDTIKSSTGVYYDRNELKQLVTSNKNPICVVTGKPLTETPDDIDAI
ncbi:hypothetical protein TRFO_17281 [Tritrichomonas foetus]|uniref:UBC core domain-containing protein n=1 Tax=Tritrichomonas foetus TaxID=1144522 RepID=A0A1J4KPH0_9EUKA|nr:hypothetical protein TRFO_17281 [Tritrichomonas foetus]|eukprot:OHT12808.1 hypothetical protein TRFO_17281 [Tritrichomonas foetus]